MARITYSALVTEIRGSIGGTTFQKNAYGFTVKNKANIIKPDSVLQNIQKRAFNQAIRGWILATATQRTAWNSFAITFPIFAKHNPSSTLTGYAYYIKYNVARIIGGQNVLQDPGTDVGQQTEFTTMFIVTAGVPDLTLEYITTVSSTEIALLHYLTPLNQLTQNFVGSKTRFMGKSLASDSSLDITAKYAQAFGSFPVDGNRYIWDIVEYNESTGHIFAKRRYEVIAGS